VLVLLTQLAAQIHDKFTNWSGHFVELYLVILNVGMLNDPVLGPILIGPL
jgi:hypothetical protein